MNNNITQKIPISQFDPSKLTLSNYDNEEKKCDVLYNGEKHVVFTTNDVRVHRIWNDTTSSMIVNFTKGEDVFGVSLLDDTIIGLISKHAMDFFNKEMTIEDLDEYLYMKSLNMKNGLPNFRFYVNTETVIIYDKTRNIMNDPIDVLKRKENKYKLALALPSLVFESTRSYLKWSPVQLLLCSRYKEEIPLLLVEEHH